MKVHLPWLAAIVISIVAAGSTSAATNELVPRRGRGIPPPNARGEGPWNTRLMLARSTNGLDFRRHQFVVSDQAGAPSLVIDEEGRARLYYVDCGNGNVLACAVQTTIGSLTNWTFQRVRVAGLPRQFRTGPVDPAVVTLPRGRFRMYFVHAAPVPEIYSALSTNALDFTLENGVRLAAGKPVADPTILRVNDEWLLWCGPEGRFAVRSTNGVSFSAPAEFRVEGARFMPWSAVTLTNGAGWRLYGNFFGPGEWSGGVSSVYSPDGRTWKRERGIRLSLDGSRYPLESRLFPDNACALLPDGTWLMVYVAGIPAPRGR